MPTQRRLLDSGIPFSLSNVTVRIWHRGHIESRSITTHRSIPSSILTRANSGGFLGNCPWWLMKLWIPICSDRKLSCALGCPLSGIWWVSWPANDDILFIFNYIIIKEIDFFSSDRTPSRSVDISPDYRLLGPSFEIGDATPLSTAVSAVSLALSLPTLCTRQRVWSGNNNNWYKLENSMIYKAISLFSFLYESSTYSLLRFDMEHGKHFGEACLYPGLMQGAHTYRGGPSWAELKARLMR